MCNSTAERNSCCNNYSNNAADSFNMPASESQRRRHLVAANIETSPLIAVETMWFADLKPSFPPLISKVARIVEAETPGEEFGFNLTFVGLAVFLAPLMQTTTCQSIDHCICQPHRGVGWRKWQKRIPVKTPSPHMSRSNSQLQMRRHKTASICPFIISNPRLITSEANND